MNSQRCRAALAQLQQARDAQGRALTIHKLHLPRPIYYTQDVIDSLQFGPQLGNPTTVAPRHAGERMAASYVNFYRANHGRMLVPQFGDAEFDARAVATLRAILPSDVTLRAILPSDVTVVGVPSREILIGGGNLHCITQQIPKMM